MLELVLASRNKHKLAEFQRMFSDLGVSIIPVSEFPEAPEVVEDGETFEENARKKATEIAKALGRPALADDSGLEVDCLGGEPGVRSARYAGEHATAEENNAKLLRRLKGVPKERRKARFRCVIALAVPEGDRIDVETASGACEGWIGFEPVGSEGFGYDPLFVVSEYNRTFAELPMELKNEISHRGRALRAAYDLIEKWKKSEERICRWGY